MDTEITPRYKDVLQKYTSALFRDTTLEYFGIKTAKVKAFLNVELPEIKVKENRADFILLMDDDSCTHLEFQSKFRKKDLTRFARYDTFIYDRDGRKVTTIIIYSADVKKADTSLKIGSLTYEPINIMMINYDGNIIYKNLEAKLKSGRELTDNDILNLIFLPLMKTDMARAELAKKTIELANTITDEDKRKLCKASAMAFADAYLSKTEFKTIMEAVRMSGVLAELLEREINEKAEVKAIEIAEEIAEEIANKIMREKAVQKAIKLIKKGLPLDDIADLTELDVDTVKDLQAKYN